MNEDINYRGTTNGVTFKFLSHTLDEDIFTEDEDLTDSKPLEIRQNFVEIWFNQNIEM